MTQFEKTQKVHVMIWANHCATAIVSLKCQKNSFSTCFEIFGFKAHKHILQVTQHDNTQVCWSLHSPKCFTVQQCFSCRPGNTFPMGGAASSKDQTWMVGTCGSFLYAWRAKDLWTWRRYPASTSSSSVTSSWLSCIEQEEIGPNTLPFLTEKVAETLVHFPIGVQHNSWLARMQVICPLTMIWSKNTLD